MDCNCNCFGMATAARVPVKRYNLLVPDVFPVVEPPFDKPLGITIERKIKKLADYLDKNEYRAPKVSRRLQRRLHRELGAGHYGYVKLAVEAYSYLLAHNKPEKSNLLANELVVRTVVKRRRFVVAGPQEFLHFKEPHLGSAVGLLLTHPQPQLRKLGVDLLIQFIKCQQTSDYVPQLEAFVPLLCKNASPQVAGDTQRASAPAATAGDAASGARAVVSAEHWAALRAACLRALLEHLRFCARLAYVSYHLLTITFSVLECVDASGQGAPQGVYMSPRALFQQDTHKAGVEGNGVQRTLEFASISRGSISHVVAASPPNVAALLVFEELAHMTRDAAEGKKVLEFVMRFLDAKGHWLGSPVLETSIAVLQQACQLEHQRYLLFSSLLRHVAAAEQLTPAERAAVLRLSVAESLQLEQALAAPALLLALRELPAVVASRGEPGQEVPPMPRLPMPSAPLGSTSASGKAASAAGQHVELAAVSTGRAASLGRPSDLQLQVLAAVDQLARRVEDSGQLLEAVSSTVARLRGPAPISTATLQCCIAAGQALQYANPKTLRGGISVPRTFPSLLLHELMGIAVSWEPQQRLLAHQLLLQLLPIATDGLKEQQAALVLSAIWHEAALETNQPASFVAMDQTLRALLGAAPAAALPQVLHLAASLQLDVLQAGHESTAAADGSRLAHLSAAQCCAVLCLCSSVLQALAAQLGQEAVQQLAVPGCERVLQQLAVVSTQGLVLHEIGGSTMNAMGTESAADEPQLFWQGPVVQLAFTNEEQQHSASFLGEWRQATSAHKQRAALAAALAALPLLEQQGSVTGVAFKPMPLASLMPRLMQAGSGNYSANSSSAHNEGGSTRVQRLRSMYRHMRQISLCDGDRAMLAPISQESAAEEPPAVSLQTASLVLPWLGGSSEGGVVGQAFSAAASSGSGPTVTKTVDDVLAEVDAALATAKEAMQQGRSLSSPAWRSVAGGSGSNATSPVAAGVQAAPPNGVVLLA